jgi:hypothetical protein
MSYMNTALIKRHVATRFAVTRLQLRVIGSTDNDSPDRGPAGAHYGESNKYRELAWLFPVHQPPEVA